MRHYKKTRLNKKIYELIINDIDKLIDLFSTHLEKYLRKKRLSSNVKEIETTNNLLKFKIKSEGENIQNSSINNKAKFSYNTEDIESNNLKLLEEKFNSFKEEFNNLREIITKKLEIE